MSDGPHGPIEDRDYLWPTPIPQTRPRWTLAIWEKGRILTEHAEWVDVPDWPALVTAMGQRKLILFVSDLSLWPLKDAAIADEYAEVSASQEGMIGSNIFYKRKRTTWHIMEPSAWGIDRSPAGLSLLRRLFTLGGCGDYPSAGGWGQAMMRLYYPRTAPRIANLARSYWQILKDHLIGGRVDAVRLGQRFDTAYEYDQNGAYAHAMLRVPCGTVAWWDAALDGGERPDTETWYACCDVTVPDTLVLSPLPRRNAEDGIVYYDHQGGQTWQAWYWREEVEFATAVGIAVTPLHALTWSATDDRFARWVQTMDMLRRKTAADPALSALVKRATVAAIGRFASAWDVGIIVSDPQPGDEPMTDPHTGPINPYWVRRSERPRPGLIPYLFSYASMVCRLETYLVAKTAYEAGTLIGTNYDAVFTTEPLTLETSTDLGGWKEKTLHHAEFPNRRALVSDEAIKLPGLSGSNREHATKGR